MSRPNIVLVVAHQMRWDSIAAAGDPNARTPTLDALIRHGVHFDQAVVSHTRSGPNLASMTTGRYPGRHGVTAAGGTLDSGSVPVWRLLSEAGYRTAAVGQLGFVPRPEAFPDRITAAEFGTDAADTEYRRWLDASGLAYPMPDFRHAGTDDVPALVRSRGCMAWPLRANQAPSAWIGDLALRFVQSAPDPFFLYVGFPDPHPPYLAPQAWLDQYDRSAMRPDPATRFPVPLSPESPVMKHLDAVEEGDYRRLLVHYYAQLSHVDYHLGRILATLNARGHTNNVVIFSAHHGDDLGVTRPLFSSPDIPIDGRLRVPLVISGFQGQRVNVRDSAPAEAADIGASIAAVAKTSDTSTRRKPSLFDRVLDANAPFRSASYSESGEQSVIARMTPHKLIQFADAPGMALCNVEEDPQEQLNLAGDRRYVRQQVALTKFLRKIR